MLENYSEKARDWSHAVAGVILPPRLSGETTLEDVVAKHVAERQPQGILMISLPNEYVTPEISHAIFDLCNLGYGYTDASVWSQFNPAFKGTVGVTNLFDNDFQLVENQSVGRYFQVSVIGMF